MKQTEIDRITQKHTVARHHILTSYNESSCY